MRRPKSRSSSLLASMIEEILSRESVMSTPLSYLAPCQPTSLASPSQRVWHPTPPPLYEVRGLLCTKRPGWCLKQGASRAVKDIYLFGSGVIRPAADADNQRRGCGALLGSCYGSRSILARWLADSLGRDEAPYPVIRGETTSDRSGVAGVRRGLQMPHV